MGYEHIVKAAGVINALFVFIAATLAVYLAYRKLKIKVEAQFSVETQEYKIPRVSKINIINKRDNTVPIDAIYLIINNEIIVTLANYQQPLILHPFESITAQGEEYSNLSIEGEEFSLLDHPELTNDWKIALSVGDRIVKCNDMKGIDPSKKYRKVESFKSSINGVVVTKDVKYIIKYIYAGKQRTAVVDRSGFFFGDWPFSPNAIQKDHLSPESVMKIMENSLGSIITNYEGYDVDDINTGATFKKPV